MHFHPRGEGPGVGVAVVDEGVGAGGIDFVGSGSG